MVAAGYSGTPLARKLGLKDGQSAAFIGLPASLDWLTGERALASVESVSDLGRLVGRNYDVIHLFLDSAAVIEAAMGELATRIRPDGMIWISWPKKASKLPTDVTEDVIRKAALAGVLVDVKVCAVDEVWSGLKLVIRKEHRI